MVIAPPPQGTRQLAIFKVGWPETEEGVMMSRLSPVGGNETQICIPHAIPPQVMLRPAVEHLKEGNVQENAGHEGRLMRCPYYALTEGRTDLIIVGGLGVGANGVKRDWYTRWYLPEIKGNVSKP